MNGNFPNADDIRPSRPYHASVAASGVALMLQLPSWTLRSNAEKFNSHWHFCIDGTVVAICSVIET